MNFGELGLSEQVCTAIAEAGYTQPTPIQEKSIRNVLMGRDLLGTAQTGTGKTAAFLLPMIDVLAEGASKPRMPRALVLEPTRELAAQVSDSFEIYAKNYRLTDALVIGGTSMREQEADLSGVVDVIIATPGRLLDLFERGQLMLSAVQFLVIDEADRMMDMGFIPDVERIVGLLPQSRQTLFFSATMPKEIRKLADRFLQDPKEVEVAPPASPAETVAQHLVVLDDMDKRAALRSLIESEQVRNALIFCNRKSDVKILHKSLTRHNYDAVALHGDMDQSDRMATLEKFKNDEARLMVCSDVAARGIDIQGLSHVFNFDIPFNSDDYVHRIGRTGRAGQKGRAFSLATPKDAKSVLSIEKLIGKEIPRHEVEEFETLPLDEGYKSKRRRGGGRKSPEKQAKKDDKAEERKPRGEKPVRKKASDDNRRPPKDRGGRRRRYEDDEPTPMGLGDHVPAFFLRALRRDGTKQQAQASK